MFGIYDASLKLFESYLRGRYQHACINGSKSVSLPFSYSVAQGSVLDPLLLCLNIRPLTEVIASTGLNHICYADDLQVTIHFLAG